MQFKDLLAAVFDAALARADKAPTRLIFPSSNTAWFHYFDKEYFKLELNGNREIFPRENANNTILVRRSTEDSHRFTGLSYLERIPGCDGLYCSLQTQALINELAYYVQQDRATNAAKLGRATPAPLSRKRVTREKAAVEVETLTPILAADFSPHNSHAREFLESVGNDTRVNGSMKATGKFRTSIWDEMNSGDDYSVARGLGLAMAKAGFTALCVQTARSSERSELEKGDNLILFGKDGALIRNLTIRKAYLFPNPGPPEIYPVEFFKKTS